MATRSPQHGHASTQAPQRPGVSIALVLTLTVATALAASLVGLVLAGGRPQPVPAGLADPGLVVGWGLRLTRLCGLLAAMMTVGSLMTAAVLLPADSPLRGGALRSSARAAGIWSATAVVGVVLTVCDTAGVPVSGLRRDLLVTWGATDQVLAALAAATAAGLVAVTAARVRSALGARILLLVALASALPVPLAGHGLTGGTAGALVVHVVAALVWTGGLAGIVAHLRGDPAALAVAVPRFSILALGAYAALGLSGLLALSAGVRLWGEGATTGWTSGYVAVAGAKAVLLLGLGVLGHQHRRRSLSRLTTGEPRLFIRLAVAEALIMAAALGLAAALARTPLPVATSDPGAHVASDTVPELSLASLLATWRPDAIVLVSLGAILATYLGGTRRVQQAGIHWPRRRTASFVGGVIVAAALLCSGIAAYASVLLSIHLAQFLAALFLVPLLLLLGRPLSLARAATGGPGVPVALAHLLSNPAHGALLTCVLLTALLRTSLVEWSLASPWWHLLVVTAAVGCGLSLLWPALAADGVTQPRSSAERIGWLMAVAVGVGVLGAQLRVGDRLLAGDWFLELRLGWADPTADQQLAGLVLLGAAAALAVASLALGKPAAAGREPEAPALERPHP